MVHSQKKRSLHVFLIVGLVGCISWLSPFVPLSRAKGEKANGLHGGFRAVTGPCNLRFPRDHGAHPGYRTEWWYYTGNVRTDSGRRFGFQLTLFRTQISPPGSEKNWPEKPSQWRTKQLYLAHAAISDLEGGRFHHHEQMARGAVGLAGAERSKGRVRVFLGAWSLEIGSGSHRLRADTDSFTIDFACEPLKPLVPHGRAGYSLKGDKAESASCYYSFTRLQVTGTLTLSGEPFSVNGTAWMDHEFSTAPLEPDLVGWDWFSLQLSDEREIMLYQLRKRDGTHSGASSGTLVHKTGAPQHLRNQDFRVELLDHWKSPETGAVYPARWRIEVLPADMFLDVAPNLADQEWVTARSTRVTYWEGSVSARGRSGGKEIEGVGYVEMTGYAQPLNLPE